MEPLSVVLLSVLMFFAGDRLESWMHRKGTGPMKTCCQGADFDAQDVAAKDKDHDLKGEFFI